jgi:DNA mismatch repair protein MutS
MMEQYLEIKAAHPGLLLFYRMGDFYELFFEDAEIASRALGIMLTKRGKHQGADIPMCGVPVERSDDYLHRLIAQGFRVAVCEQMEDPAAARARGNKSVVRRDVVRLVTPGTLTEDTLLDARANNYLLAIARLRGAAGADRLGLAWIDISTSEFIVTECAVGELAATLSRINPNEIIVTDALYGDTDVGPTLREWPAVTPLTRDVFDSSTAERRLCDYFAVATMDGLSAMSRLEATAAAAAVTYIDRTQVGKRPPLSPPSREAVGTTMAIDPATRANLELTRTLGGERRGSLLDAIDCTVTSAGSRLLAQRIAAPLTDSAAIARRLDAVAAFVADSGLRDDLRSTLHAAPDLSRRWRGCRLDAAVRAILQVCATPSSPPIRRWFIWRGWSSLRRRSHRRWRRCVAHRGNSQPNSTARWPSNCRYSSATAASCAKATNPRSMNPVICAMPRGLSLPRCRRAMPTALASRV